jgi:hypothetical protein
MIEITVILDEVKKIREADIFDLKNERFLEKFIADLGLYPKKPQALAQFPKELHEYCDKGLRIWQYPNQLSKLAIKLTEYEIHKYLEIGSARCGTLIFLHEYLSRFNDIISMGVDCCEQDYNVKKYISMSPYISNIQCTSNKLFKHVSASSEFDLVLIDADHSYPSVKSDFEMVKDKTKAVMFHDIVNKHCNGSIKFWLEFKEKYSDQYDIFEFIDQYDEVYQRTKKTYLGIGLAVKKGAFNV